MSNDHDPWRDLLKRADESAARLEEVDRSLSDPAVSKVPARLRDLGKERSDLEPIVTAAARLRRTLTAISEAEELISNSSDADLVDEDLLRHIAATLVGDAHIDVVRKCLEQLLGHPTNPRRRRIREQHRHHTIGGILSDRQSGLARPEHVDSLSRPEPEEQVDVVDVVIAVQVREEDRPDRAATTRSPVGVHRDPRSPGLVMHAFAAVDDVRGVADDDGVRIASPSRLGVGSTCGAQQDQALRGIGAQRRARRAGSRRWRVRLGSAAKNV